MCTVIDLDDRSMKIESADGRSMPANCMTDYHRNTGSNPRFVLR
jgi:hypothetical protein